jgi:biopolymer transport protein ExbD/biopolymer transport protein TolR
MAFLRSKEKLGGMKTINDINVTPMVDVMLVLLIIFMVITPMLSKGVSVDMVRARNPIAMDEADKEDAILVAITRDGKVFLGTSQVEIKDLGKSISDEINTRIDKTVYVKSDARARYDVVVEVVNGLRSVGVDQVGLLTEKLMEGQSSTSVIQ